MPTGTGRHGTVLLPGAKRPVVSVGGWYSVETATPFSRWLGYLQGIHGGSQGLGWLGVCDGTATARDTTE